MTDNNELARLEEIIENLLERYNDLQRENRNNLHTIEEKNTEIENLQARLSGLESEKSHVQDRISGILKSIEEWEAGSKAEEQEEQVTASSEEGHQSEEEWPKLFGTDS